jgi:hypothetical protein
MPDLGATVRTTVADVSEVMEMNTRFGRLAIAWALVLVTVWLGDRLYRRYVDVADEPKRVTPAGTLSDWESSTIALFRAAGASVAYITTEQVRFNPFRGARVAQGAGSGFIWDQAGTWSPTSTSSKAPTPCMSSWPRAIRCPRA